MAKRIFSVKFEGECKIELDEKVIDAVDEEFCKSIYNLNTLDKIVQHLAYNLIINDADLSQLDGWADQPNENARIIQYPEWDIEAEEIYI